MHMPYDIVILRSHDLTALVRVYVLLLGLRLTISRLSVVSMHFVLCRSLRILEDMSFLSFLRILVLLEEPPHLMADKYLGYSYAWLLQKFNLRWTTLLRSLTG